MLVPSILDNPIWFALSGPQASLAQGDAFARRYPIDIAPFAAISGYTPESFLSLGNLIGSSTVMLQSVEPLPANDLNADVIGTVLQMIKRGADVPVDGEGVLRLGLADVPDMLELTDKAKPGPFSVGTIVTGSYIGLRDNGKLIAMAGERMRLDGYTEISAVCVDENYRGNGIAGRLIKILQTEIMRRGETPFLHVIAEKTSAIELYQRMGFEIRQTFHINRITGA